MGKVNELKDFTRGQIDAVLMKIGQDAGMGTSDGIRAFLAGKLVAKPVTTSWHRSNGWIFFKMSCEIGLNGEEWITRLEAKGAHVDDCTKKILRSPDFRSAWRKEVGVVVLDGAVFNNDDRITKNIRAYAQQMNLLIHGYPSAELACLIRERITDEDMEKMGLFSIVTMHEPIKGSDGKPQLLVADRYSAGYRLSSNFAGPDHRWGRDEGFAFVASQTLP